MLRKHLNSPLLTIDSAPHFTSCKADLTAASSSIPLSNIRYSCGSLQSVSKAKWTSNHSTDYWVLRSTTQIENTITSNEDRSMWEACRQALSTFNFSDEEKDKILGKAFGLIHSPYWGEDRTKEVPKFEAVNATLDYLRSLNLSDDDLSKLLKKFPEVLGCNLEEELKANTKILKEQWGIEGKSLRNLLLRNPKVLGYNIDCKGDCMAQCTRCWVRF